MNSNQSGNILGILTRDEPDFWYLSTKNYPLSFSFVNLVILHLCEIEPAHLIGLKLLNRLYKLTWIQKKRNF